MMHKLTTFHHPPTTITTRRSCTGEPPASTALDPPLVLIIMCPCHLTDQDLIESVEPPPQRCTRGPQQPTTAEGTSCHRLVEPRRPLGNRDVLRAWKMCGDARPSKPRVRDGRPCSHLGLSPAPDMQTNLRNPAVPYGLMAGDPNKKDSCDVALCARVFGARAVHTFKSTACNDGRRRESGQTHDPTPKRDDGKPSTRRPRNPSRASSGESCDTARDSLEGADASHTPTGRGRLPADVSKRRDTCRLSESWQELVGQPVGRWDALTVGWAVKRVVRSRRRSEGWQSLQHAPLARPASPLRHTDEALVPAEGESTGGGRTVGP